MFCGKVVRILMDKMVFIFIFVTTNKSTINITKLYITTVSFYTWVI